MTTRRLLLGLLGALTIGAPAIEGCAAQFDPPSKIIGLRVLSVVASEPYVTIVDGAPKPVTFEMTYHDENVDPATGEQTGERELQIVWLGPCVDPPGDQYYACYPQFAEAFAELQKKLEAITKPEEVLELCTEGVEAAGITIQACSTLLGGTSFQVDIPPDIVTRRPPPTSGPYYGVAYVFFLACAGTLGLVADSSDGRAGSFPVGCFDRDTGARLGADSFVPGYTQVYSFANPPVINTNPAIVAPGLTLDGQPITDATRVKPCSVPEEDRRALGCGKEDPFTACDAMEIKVVVDPQKVAENDQSSETPDGNALKEAVWVDYFATGGDFDASVKLVSDPEKGFNSDLGSKWIAPSKNSLVTLYAVVHDARGGQAVISREVSVTDEAAPAPAGSGGTGGAGGGGGAPVGGGGG